MLTAPDALATVQEALQKANISFIEAKLAMVPKNTIHIEGKTVGSLLKMLDVLEEHDDVQNVFSNADIDDKEMEALA